MAKLKEVAVGERWAYRRAEKEQLVEVEVLGLGTTKPARVKIRFAADDEPEAWVPPNRLKALWAERERFTELESRWLALVSDVTEIEEAAVDYIVQEFLSPAADLNSRKFERATIVVYDAELVDVFIGGGFDEIVRDADRIDDERGSHYGWAVALDLVTRLCVRKRERVLTLVRSEEARGQSLAAVGGPWRHSATHSTVADAALVAEFHEEYTRPKCDLIRGWCGEGRGSVEDELGMARRESARFADLFTRAVALLADAGDRPASWALYAWAYPDARELDWHSVVDRGVLERREWRAGFPKSARDV